jgi:hypothetical protein
VIDLVTDSDDVDVVVDLTTCDADEGNETTSTGDAKSQSSH